MAVTSGTVWRERHRAVEVQLPSGNTALLRPLNGSFLLRLTGIPAHLTGLVVELVQSGGRVSDLSDAEKLHHWFELMDEVCKAMFVNPRIVPDPQQNDEISIEDLDDEDRTFVMGLIGKGVRELESFRPKQTVNVVGVADESGDGGDTPVPSPELATMGK